MTGKIRVIVPISIVITGISLLLIYLLQPVSLIINGKHLSVRTLCLSAAGIARSARLTLYAGDIVVPDPSDWVLNKRPIIISNSSNVSLWLEDQRIPVTSTTMYPYNLLQEYGIKVFPGDVVIVDGKQERAGSSFNSARIHTVQVHKTTAVSTGTDGATIGQTLAMRGAPLMGLDRTGINENMAYLGGEIPIQRVQDTLEIKTSGIPFEYKSIQDPAVDLDMQVVTQAGINGLSLDLTRFRSVNGEPGAPVQTISQIIRQPVDQILSYGTNAVVKQAVVDGVTLNYWRAVSMYATSYSPCHSGVADCLYGTASGMPVAKGVAAVVSRWFPYMNGQRIYVPGYGFATIADTGGGIPGQYWIDLGFSDADYESWHQWVTVYFLEPVPPNILYVLN